MKKLIVMMLLAVMTGGAVISCKSNKDKARETVEAYLYKNMKNPESLKILSCEVRLDTIPFYLSNEMFKMTVEAKEALDKFYRYNKMGYLFATEALEWSNKATDAKEALSLAYKTARENDPIDIEYIAYVRSSGTNAIGGTVSNTSVFILDKDDPEKILGVYTVDTDFIQQFVTLKIFCEDYEFKQNKFGKFITDDMPYFEQFVMNEAE